MYYFDHISLRSKSAFRIHFCISNISLHKLEESVLPKLIHEFDAALVIISPGFSVDIYKLSFKVMWKLRGLKISKGTLKVRTSKFQC